MGTRVYTVHAPPGEATPERVRFLKDGFSWPALFFALPWILWHRLWLTLVWFIVWILAVMWIGRLFGDQAASVLGALGAILFALEANNIRRLSLAQKGWRDLGSSYGRNLEEAEIRFFAGAGARGDSGLRDRRDGSFWPGDDAPAAYGDEPVLGLFPEPEPQARR